MVYWSPYPWYIDPHTHGILTPLSMVFWPPYPWYIDPPNHGILTPITMVFWHPLPMVYRPPYPWYIYPHPNHGILTPYPWYFDPLPMVYRPSLSMAFWPPYPWYIDPLTMVFWPLPMVYRSPYPWYFDPLTMVYRPPTHGILIPYPWYIDPPNHGISTPLTMVFWPPPHPGYLLIRNEGGQNTMGVQFTIQGGSVFNKGGQYTMDKNWPRCQYAMGVKIPYDTGLQWASCYTRVCVFCVLCLYDCLSFRRFYSFDHWNRICARLQVEYAYYRFVNNIAFFNWFLVF